MDSTFQYPPELLALVCDTIPKLCKSKKELLLFFQGAGVMSQILTPFELLLRNHKEAFNKYTVTREIVAKLNVDGDKSLTQRREILKRITEFENFSVCWENDQSPARGLVAQIRELVNVKDSFTRMNIEREREQQIRRDASKKELTEKNLRREKLEGIKRRLFALFPETNPHKRGKALEGILNEFFEVSGVLISEAITVKGDPGAGIVEQIDGVIQLRGQLFLVEIKWEQETLGKEKTAPHLVRLFSRGLAGGIIISYSDFSAAAINDCKEALRDKAVILCNLEELVRVIDRQADLSVMFQTKLDAAIIRKNPLELYL